MPRPPVLCLLRRRATAPGRLLVHSEPGRRQQPASAMDVAVGIMVFFTTFLTPCAYVLSRLDQFRRQ